MCFYFEEFTTDGINYDKIRRTIDKYSYTLNDLSRKIKEPAYKIRKALIKEGKHNAIDDLIIYTKIAMFFDIQVEKLIY